MLAGLCCGLAEDRKDAAFEAASLFVSNLTLLFGLTSSV